MPVVESAATELLNLPKTATEQQVKNAIGGDPKTITELRRIALEATKAEMDYETTLATLEVKDMADARLLYKTGDPVVQKAMIAGAFLLSFLTIALVAYMDINGYEKSDLLVTIATASVGLIVSVFQFFFGSSLGSKLKDRGNVNG